MGMAALLEALDFFAEAGGNNWAPIARSLLAQMHSNFVVRLEIMNVILGLCAALLKLCNLRSFLWTELSRVCSLTREMDPQTLQNADEQWDQIWANANAITDYCELQAPPVRRIRRAREERAERVEHPNNIQGSDEFRRLMYTPICVAVHEELVRRFLQEEHNDIYQDISALTPASEKFLETAKIVSFALRTEVDAEVLRTEVTVVRNLFPTNLIGFFQFVRPFKMRCIPLLHNCLTIACTRRVQMNAHSP